MKVFKYTINVIDSFGSFIVTMHGAAPQILCVQMQNDIPCIWALVDQAQPLVDQTFRIVGTGHNADGVGKYVGTFQVQGLVFHLFHQGEG